MELRQLTPCAHDNQLDAINRLGNVITSVLYYLTTLPWQPTQLSVCAALLERLGNTRAMDTMGPQYKIKFQYDTSVFTVMASSGHLPFDPHQVDLPSIPTLVAFYHACLGFLVKDTWLNAIKVGNCDMFVGLTYLNVACYCPNSDETILGHLVQMRQNVQSTKPQSTPCTSLLPTIESPMPLAKALQEVFLHVYPISKLHTDDTGQFPVWARLGNQCVMIVYRTDGNLILQQAFQTKADKHCISAFNTIMARLAARSFGGSYYQR